MAYARFGGGSDIYLFGSVGEHSWTCCMCRLANRDASGFHDDACFDNLQDVQSHLEAHIAAGDHVHEECIIRVAKELEDQTPLQNFTEKANCGKVSLKRKN